MVGGGLCEGAGGTRVVQFALYDLTADPHMTHDLMPTQPELATPMKAILTDWVKEYAGNPGAAPDPMQAALERDPVLYSDPERYIARLEATGGKQLVEDCKRRLDGSLDLPYFTGLTPFPRAV